MNTERPACGLGSLLPMSCRGRAEAFARRLQSRLQTLGRGGPGGAGSVDPHSTADENSWLAPRTVTTRQPRLSSSSDSDLYFDFDVDLGSPASPAEEATDQMVSQPVRPQDPESGCVLSSPSPSPGSDSSDGPYFDLENPDMEYAIHRVSKPTASIPFNKCNGHIDLNSGSTTADLKHNSIPSVNSTTSENHCFTSDVHKDNVINELLNCSLRDKRNCSHCTESPELESNSSTQQPRMSSSCNPSSDLPVQANESALHCSDSGISINQQNGERIKDLSEESCSGPDEGSYCSTFSRPSGLMIECPDQVGHLLPVIAACPNGSLLDDVDNVVPQSLKEWSLDASPTECLCSTNTIEDVTLEDEGSAGCRVGEDVDKEENASTEQPEVNGADCKADESLLRRKDMPTVIFTQQSVESDAMPTGDDSSGSPQIPDSVGVSVPVEQCEDKERAADRPILEPLIVNNEECTLVVASTNNTDEDDDDDSPPQRVRRSTSLKSGKTPPGTPGRKKIVRFADALGLDLADVRTFLDEVPRVPSSAYRDLLDADLSLGSSAMPVVGCFAPAGNPHEPTKCLVPLFQQPGGQPDFLDRVRERQVCLENAVVKDPVMFSIAGTVRVRNLDFNKSVQIRYTLDGWVSYADLQATYVSNSCDGFSDKFTFLLYAHTLSIGQRLEFAVRFHCKGSQFWDNNQGANYTFQCLPPASSTPFLPLPSPEDRWHSFY